MFGSVLLVLLPLIAEIFTGSFATKLVLRNPLCTPRPSNIDEICKIYYEREKLNKQLILPPNTVQLPSGLGYFPAAVPDVKSAYLRSLYYSGIIQEMDDLVIPMNHADSCISLASPLCPYLGQLINPIIL